MARVESNSRRHLAVSCIRRRSRRGWTVLIDSSASRMNHHNRGVNFHAGRKRLILLNRGMQDCFRENPDVYGSELEDDEEGQDEERSTNAAPAELDMPTTSIPPPPSQPPDSDAPGSGDDDVAKTSGTKAATKQVREQHDAQSETEELMPKAWHDGTTSSNESK